MRTIIFILSCLLLFARSQAQIIPTVSKTVAVQVAGTMSTLFSNDDMNNIAKLTITGNIDARDISFFYGIYNLSVLDLSNANIIEYNGAGGVGPEPYSVRLYPANEMPPYSFVFLDFNSTLTSVILPKSLKSIAGHAFFNCRSLSTVTMYDSLISIGENAFYSCMSLTYIDIPRNVSTIAYNAFTYCIDILTYNVSTENLHFTSQDGVLYNKDKSVLFAYPQAKSGSFTIPTTVILIGNSAFYNCKNLTNIQISNLVSEIGEMAFMSCTSINSIVIPNNVIKINKQAFEFCTYLNSVSLPDSLSYIGELAFCACEHLNNLIIPKKVSYIGDFAFAQCLNLTSISLPDSINSINEWMFNSCRSLKEIVIPNTVDSIKYGAFQSCGKLENMKIGKEVRFIGSRSFVDCVSLKSIYAYPTNPADLNLSLDVFTNVNKTNCILYVPLGSKATYGQANQWKDFKNIEEITTGMQSIDQREIKIIMGNEKVIIENAKVDDKVEIYDILGKKIKELLIESNQEEILLPKGIFVIRVESYSKKVIIK